MSEASKSHYRRCINDKFYFLGVVGQVMTENIGVVGTSLDFCSRESSRIIDSHALLLGLYESDPWQFEEPQSWSTLSPPT